MSANTRREFLGMSLPRAVALGASLATLHPLPALGSEPQTSVRSYGASKFALEIDGIHAGWLESVEGGDATADVITDQVGPGGIQYKHLARPKYNDIVLTCGSGMSNGFYDWVKTTLDKKPVFKSGAIVVLDYAGRPASRMEWGNGLISEVTFPACDGSSKDAAVMTVKIAPEITRSVAPSTGKAAILPPQKRWSAANFRLQITGCPTACSHVSAIDAIVLKFVLSLKPSGDLRQQLVPGHVEVPNLAVMTAESWAAEFVKWHEDFVVNGQNTRDKEKSATLDYLGPDLKPLFTLSFTGLGIFKLAPEKMTAGAEMVRRVRVEMYCDSINLA